MHVQYVPDLLRRDATAVHHGDTREGNQVQVSQPKSQKSRILLRGGAGGGAILPVTRRAP